MSNLPDSVHADLMDRTYRLQRHIYDASRRFFLLGRDELLERAVASSPRTILEIGVGTGRNLIKLARACPHTQLFGFDVSNEMLKTARERIDDNGLSGRIQVKQGLAEQFDAGMFLPAGERFDVVFFSYSLSMMQNKKLALWNAFNAIDWGGRLLAVDFGDQRSFPAFFRKSFQKFLIVNHVFCNQEHVDFLAELDWRGLGGLTVVDRMGGFCRMVQFDRSRPEEALRIENVESSSFFV